MSSPEEILRFLNMLGAQALVRVRQLAWEDLLNLYPEYVAAGGGHEWGYVDRRLDTTLRFIATHLAPAR